jgi:uncharacterized membrane protein YjjP (DUF1212 family)
MLTSTEAETATALPQPDAPLPENPPAGAPVPGAPELPPTRVQKVLRLALRMGDILLAAGMPAHDVVVLMLRIAESYGIGRVHFDITYTAMMTSYYPPQDGIPITEIRVVRAGATDFSRAQAIEALAGQIRAGLPLEEASAACKRIREAPSPYPWWAATAGKAGVAAAVALLFSASWKLPLLTFAIGILVDRVLAALRDRRFPAFFSQLLAAGLITLIAALVSNALNHGIYLFVGVRPSLVVVSGIIMLVAGMRAVGAAQDALDEFYLTALARGFQAAMHTAGIVVGIVIALYLSRALNFPIVILPNPDTVASLPRQFIAVTLTSALFALSCYASPGTIALSGAMGFIGYAGYILAMAAVPAAAGKAGAGAAGAGAAGAGAPAVLASTAGAALTAWVATMLIRRARLPGFALINAALIPLVPGLTLFKGLFQMVGAAPGTGDLMEGALIVFPAAGVALGIAAGASLGAYLGRPMADRLRRIRETALEQLGGRGRR